MGGVYPELVERASLIAKITREEETRFRETLERGVRLLDEKVFGEPAAPSEIPGADWRSCSTTPTASRSI